MLVILQAGGFQGGGINFDAKVRRNSTDPVDLFYAHIGGMDAFARALIAADAILRESPYLDMRRARYQSFDDGQGLAYEKGLLSLEDLYQIATAGGEPVQQSGKQELFENLLSRFI